MYMFDEHGGCTRVFKFYRRSHRVWCKVAERYWLFGRVAVVRLQPIVSRIQFRN
jgi:hypothetical protein